MKRIQQMMGVQNLQVTENVKVESLAHRAPSRVQNLVYRKHLVVKVLLTIPILTYCVLRLLV